MELAGTVSVKAPSALARVPPRLPTEVGGGAADVLGVVGVVGVPPPLCGDAKV
jgi:hypothetical protein